MNAAIVDPLAATVDVGASLPFARPRFYGGPDPASADSTLFRAPAVGGRVAAGLLLRLP
jgi:hypothetical protein